MLLKLVMSLSIILSVVSYPTTSSGSSTDFPTAQVMKDPGGGGY